MRKISIVILLLLCGIYSIIGILTDRVTFTNLQVMGGLGIAQFCFSIWTSLKNGQKLISPYVVFLCALYVFSFGQSLLYPFNLTGDRDLDGFMDITQEQIFDAQILTLVFLAFFHIGSLILSTSHKGSTNEISSIKYTLQNGRLKRISWIFFIISFYPYYSKIITNATLSLTLGYAAIYDQEAQYGIDNFSGILANYFIPSLIGLYIAYVDNIKWRRFFAGIFLFNCFVLLMTGGRTEAVIMLSLLMIIHNYLVKPFAKKTIVLLLIGSVFFLSILATIAETRTTSNRDVSLMTSSESNKTNGAVNAISEMGWSMFCLIQTESLVPRTEDFRYGTTYLYSTTSIIPNLGFWAEHPAKKGANMSNWLSDKLNTSFGTGFSMCAEAYLNFGYLGGFIMLLFGYIAAKLFGELSKYINTRNIAAIALVLILFWFSLKMPRNSFIGIVRGICFYALPIYWYTRGYIVKK